MNTDLTRLESLTPKQQARTIRKLATGEWNSKHGHSVHPDHLRCEVIVWGRKGGGPHRCTYRRSRTLPDGHRICEHHATDAREYVAFTVDEAHEHRKEWMRRKGYRLELKQPGAPAVGTHATWMFRGAVYRTGQLTKVSPGGRIVEFLGVCRFTLRKDGTYRQVGSRAGEQSCLEFEP